MIKTQEEFDRTTKLVQKHDPKLYSLLLDYIHGRFTKEEDKQLISLPQETAKSFIDSYKPRTQEAIVC
jgi:hypothetical protein